MATFQGTKKGKSFAIRFFLFLFFLSSTRKYVIYGVLNMLLNLREARIGKILYGSVHKLPKKETRPISFQYRSNELVQ